MNQENLIELNRLIGLLQSPADVTSYNIDKSLRIEFPRVYLRTMAQHKSYFNFIQDNRLLTKVASHMMHRDTLHWLWLKTDLWGYAREMVIKFQLVNLATILEAVIKHLTTNVVSSKKPVHHHINHLYVQKIINNPIELKKLWADRNSIHLHLTGDVDGVEFNDGNYQSWHSAMAILIEDLNRWDSTNLTA